MSAEEIDDVNGVIAETLGSIEVLARALHVQDARLQPTLEAIVAQAIAAHPGAQDAGLILLRAGQLIPQVVTGPAPQLLDARQQQTGIGPCIEAAREQTLISIDDLSDDPRWPGFSAEAQECGVASMLCAPLWVNDQLLGTLSLYASKPGAFGEHDRRLVSTFAALAALALAEAQRTEQLTTAIRNRDVIGQAKGIIMERYQLSADVAFSTLARISQAQNKKLHEVAQLIANTRQIPDTTTR